jgi:hypothetical protein
MSRIKTANATVRGTYWSVNLYDSGRVEIFRESFPAGTGTWIPGLRPAGCVIAEVDEDLDSMALEALEQALWVEIQAPALRLARRAGLATRTVM